MTDDVTGPIDVELSKDDVQALKDGETISIVLAERNNWKDQLEIQWKTVGEFGDSEIVDNIKGALNNE